MEVLHGHLSHSSVFFLGKLQQSVEFRAAAIPAVKCCWRSCCEDEVKNVSCHSRGLQRVLPKRLSLGGSPRLNKGVGGLRCGEDAAALWCR